MDASSIIHFIQSIVRKVQKSNKLFILECIDLTGCIWPAITIVQSNFDVRGNCPPMAPEKPTNNCQVLKVGVASYRHVLTSHHEGIKLLQLSTIDLQSYSNYQHLRDVVTAHHMNSPHHHCQYQIDPHYYHWET